MNSKLPMWIGLILSPVVIVIFWMMNSDISAKDAHVTTAPKMTLRSINYIPTKTKQNISDHQFYLLSDSGAVKKKLSDYAGKPIVLHFWATWCGACVEEMPEFEKFAKKYGKDVHIIAVASDKLQSTAVKKFYEENGITNLSVFIDDNNEMARPMQVRALPTTVFVNSKGSEIGRIEGPVEWMDEPGVVLTNYIKKK